MQLALIHRPRRALLPPADVTRGATCWRTCLREVLFLGPEAVVNQAPGEDECPIVRDADAYALLLEIVCGLRSPLLGETEVQAQFKDFLAALDPVAERWLRRVGERVLADAKLIRHGFLQGFGAHSYGQIAVRYLEGDRVALIGTGALAREVLVRVDPRLPVDVWRRRPDRDLRAGSPSVRHFLIGNAHDHADTPCSTTEPTSVVVAAPIGERDLNGVLHRYSRIVRIIDLRAADQQTRIERRVPTITLGALLEESAAERCTSTAAIPAAMGREIRRRAHAFACREELRPFGWEDLCA